MIGQRTHRRQTTISNTVNNQISGLPCDRLSNLVNRMTNTINDEKETLETRRCPQILWTIFCVTCCLLQTYQISELYFRRTMNSETQLYPKDPIKPPAITFCTTSGLNISTNSLTYKQQLAIERSSFLYFERAFQWSDLFYNISITEVDGQVYYIDDNEQRMKDFDMCCVRTYKLMDHLCYQLDTNRHLKQRYTHAMVGSFRDPFVLSLAIRPEMVAHQQEVTIILLNDPRELLGRINSVLMRFAEKKERIHTYRRRHLRLLKWPFSTNCVDYDFLPRKHDESSVESQDDCLQQCLFELAFDDDRPIPLKIPVPNYLDENVTLATDDDVDETDVKTCNYRCRRLDCDLISYHAKSLDTDVSEDNSTRFTLTFQTEPDLNVFYAPKITPLEFVALVSSILCSWIGFNFMNILDFIYDSLGSLRSLASSNRRMPRRRRRSVTFLRTA